MFFASVDKRFEQLSTALSCRRSSDSAHRATVVANFVAISSSWCAACICTSVTLRCALSADVTGRSCSCISFLLGETEASVSQRGVTLIMPTVMICRSWMNRRCIRCAHARGTAILPLTVLRRFDCALADTQEAVLADGQGTALGWCQSHPALTLSAPGRYRTSFMAPCLT